MFAKKFDALMRISEVSNSNLAKAINMNGSHIGRLRNGVRALPKNHDFLEPTCAYLLGRITKEYQYTALDKLIGIDCRKFKNINELSEYVLNWLIETDLSSELEQIISDFAYFSSRRPTVNFTLPNESKVRLPNPYYYGVKGKQEAVEQLFLMVLEEKSPQTILLFSDENMEWFYEDGNFSKRWGVLFKQVLEKGNRVHIIHSVNCDMSELMEAVLKWVPIYMAGAIIPFYYPRIRDGIYHRTLFIAPKTAALVSTSVQQKTEDMLHFFVTEEKGIKALVKEFENYHQLCKPLMHILVNQGDGTCIRHIEQLVRLGGNTIVRHAMPLVFSMPERLASKIANKYHRPDFYALWKRSRHYFEQQLKNAAVTEMLLLPKIALKEQDKLFSPAVSMFIGQLYVYTVDDYLEHIANLNELEKNHANFSVIYKDDIPANMLIYALEDVGVVMSKTDLPEISFLFDQANMIQAFWDYLKLDSKRNNVR